MTADTLFWIASFTKLVTSIAALQLAEAGELALDQSVASILPDFAELPILDGFDDAGAPRLRPAADAPTVRHLLTHTSGLGYPFMDAELARYAELEGIGLDGARRLPRRFAAGARWHYGVSTDWLGAVVEAVAGETLDVVVSRAITGPLSMTDTTFAPGPAQKARAAAVHARLPDGGLVPIDFPLPPPPNFSMGGGGLYSTAGDYLRLLTALLEGKILNAASREALLANQVGDLQCSVIESSNPVLTNDFEPMPGAPKRWGLGLLINPERGPDGRAAGSGAWAGLANCYYWLDPANGVAGVLLTQILPFADERALRLFSTFERAVYH
jgi:CubicO group peptidase (beta-lactamase class C family)